MIFQYASLLGGSIRLVRFHPTSTPLNIHLILEHQERYFENNVHYKALTYESHDETGEMKEITLQGRTKLIPRTLWRALSALLLLLVDEHHDTSGRFWVDYVCVNQRDDAERLVHQRRISEIYASADEVLLWLGSGRFDAEVKSWRDSNAFQSIVERLQLQRAKKVTLLTEKSILESEQTDPHSAL